MRQYAESPAWLAAGGYKRIEELRRQTAMERPASVRIDVDAVALQAFRSGPVPLVDRDVDASFLQTLRQTETADAAADN
jgi:hypothetical protein